MTGEDRQTSRSVCSFRSPRSTKRPKRSGFRSGRSTQTIRRSMLFMKSPAGTQFVAAIVGGAGGHEASTVVAEPRLAALGIEVLVVIGIAGSLDSRVATGRRDRTIPCRSLPRWLKGGPRCNGGRLELLFAEIRSGPAGVVNSDGRGSRSATRAGVHASLVGGPSIGSSRGTRTSRCNSPRIRSASPKLARWAHGQRA